MAVATDVAERPRTHGRIRRPPDYTGLSGQFTFYWHALKAIPRAVHYRRQIAEITSDITIGVGALVVGAGTFFVIFSMAFFTGTQVGLEGFQGLRSIGAAAPESNASAAGALELAPPVVLKRRHNGLRSVEDPATRGVADESEHLGSLVVRVEEVGLALSRVSLCEAVVVSHRLP
jgi:hypothetical protein